MERFLNVPLYTYRVSCEGGHIYLAMLPERSNKDALKGLKSDEIAEWFFLDRDNSVKSVAVVSSKIVGLEEFSKDPRVLTNKAGKLSISAYKAEKKEEAPVGRVARKGYKHNV